MKACVSALTNLFIKKTMDKNISSADVDIELYTALRESDLEAAKMCLNQGADPNAVVGDLDYVLYESMAVPNHFHDFFNLFMAHKANLKQRGPFNETILIEMIRHQQKPDESLLRACLDAKIDIDAQDNFRHSALHYALRIRDSQWVDLLLEHGALVETPDFNAVIETIEAGQFKTFQKLLPYLKPVLPLRDKGDPVMMALNKSVDPHFKGVYLALEDQEALSVLLGGNVLKSSPRSYRV